MYVLTSQYLYSVMIEWVHFYYAPLFFSAN